MSSFPEVFYEKGCLKNFIKFTDKHKKQSSGGVLSKDVHKNVAKFTENHLCRSLFFNKVTGGKAKTVRSSHWRCSVKKGFLKTFANFTGKHLCWSLFLKKLQSWGPVTLLKKTPTQEMSCEKLQNFISNNFEEYLWTTASKLYWKRDSNAGFYLWILRIIQEHLFCRASTKGWFWHTSKGVSYSQSCKPGVLKAFKSIRKRLWHKYFPVNFVKSLVKHFIRASPRNHFSHNVLFFLIANEWDLHKINLFGGAMAN